MKSAKDAKLFFYEDKPLFGFDLGYGTLRVMQLELGHGVPRLKGYGSIAFDPSALQDGVIIKPEAIAKVAKHLFKEELVGDISTKRVAVSLPASRAFTRALQLPKMNAKDINEAVRTEAAQYMPATLDNLYLDYVKVREEKDTMDIFVVAMPKRIIDSYLVLARLLGLEPVLFDTTVGANARLYAHDKQSDVPSVLIDFGTKSTDITVFNQGLIVTGTVPFGGETITQTIARSLHLTPREAIMLKSTYGLSKSIVQKQITTALEPALQQLIKEIRRSIRYYEEHHPNDPPISQIVTMGGGANMPGLSGHLTEQLRMAARSFDPIAHIDFGNLHPFYNADHMSYVTVAGLAVTNPREIFQ